MQQARDARTIEDGGLGASWPCSGGSSKSLPKSSTTSNAESIDHIAMAISIEYLIHITDIITHITKQNRPKVSRARFSNTVKIISTRKVTAPVTNGMTIFQDINVGGDCNKARTWVSSDLQIGQDRVLDCWLC